MRWIGLFAKCALVMPLLAGAMGSDIAQRQSLDIPACMVRYLRKHISIRLTKLSAATMQECWSYIEHLLGATRTGPGYVWMP